MSGKLDKAGNCSFSNPNVYIDIGNYIENKIYDINHADLIIELIGLTEDGNEVVCIFATICKIYPDTVKHSSKIKVDSQKLKVNNQWFNMTEVYGLTAGSNECEICCTNKRDTIFLPCKHSYACRECAIMIRIKANNCPICRQPISESIVIESETQEN